MGGKITWKDIRDAYLVYINKKSGEIIGDIQRSGYHSVATWFPDVLKFGLNKRIFTQEDIDAAEHKFVISQPSYLLKKICEEGRKWIYEKGNEELRCKLNADAIEAADSVHEGEFKNLADVVAAHACRIATHSDAPCWANSLDYSLNWGRENNLISQADIPEVLLFYERRKAVHALEMISWKGLEAVVGSELNAFLNYGLENGIFGEDNIKTEERKHRVFRAREGISTYICFHDPEKALSEYREDLQWGLENSIFSPIEIIDGYRKGLFVIGKGMVVRING